jgi:hypothetical protein
MRKTVLRAIAITAVLSPAVAFTQSGKTKPTTATYITKEEVDTVNKNGQGIDRNIKVVDIGHENYTVGIIHRGKTVNGVAVPSGAAAANAAPATGRAGGAAAPAPEPCGRQMATAPAGGTAGAVAEHSDGGLGASDDQEITKFARGPRPEGLLRAALGQVDGDALGGER